MSLRLALLGDSVAAGRGAESRTETPAALLTHRLRDRGISVTTRVFAVPGALSAHLGGQVDQALPWHPQVAVVIVGANDLIHHTVAACASRNLGDAVGRLRGAGAEVVVAPAPDLSALPDTPAGLKHVLHAASMALREAQVAAALAAGAHVADPDQATAVRFAADRRLFCDDRFHPSGAGYAVIADALFPEVSAAIRRRRRAWTGEPPPARSERGHAKSAQPRILTEPTS